MKDLIRAQDEYIDFLHEYIGGLAAYLSIHKMSPNEKQIKKAERLRDEINRLKNS